ncbi:MAG: chemotaxis protein CheB [bacterium]|nr:chemotaxis protein CheB [bacterium]
MVDCLFEEKMTEETNEKNKNGVIRGIVVIGSSSGGPGVVGKIISGLPKTFPHPIVVVQHMPGNFTKIFAENLNRRCPLTVKEVDNEEPLRSGYCYVAKGDCDIELTANYVIRVKESSGVYVPSIDRFMLSVARVSAGLDTVIGVVLSGMGKDGAQGLLEIKKANGFTIAQNKETSVIFGMPLRAIELDAVVAILPMDEIAQTIIDRVSL